MALFGRTASIDDVTAQARRMADTMHRVAYARESPSVLRASGMRIEPMSADRLRMVAGNRQPWQSLAWSYRDMIIELRYAFQFRARAISRVKFYIGEIIDDDDEPIPVSMRNDEDAEKRKRVTIPPALATRAEDELARLPLSSYSFTGTWCENYDVAGDCWLHGFQDRWTGAERWQIRSVMDVDVAGSTMTVKDELGQPRRVNLETEELYRLWVPHPAHPHLADSALNAGSDVLEDITLTGRELRAASRSRIMTNGILLVPESMTQMRMGLDDTETPTDRRDKFISELTATLLAPISNEGDAGAVVPAVLTGSRDDLEALRHLRLEREDSPTLLAKLDKAMGRMANGLDIPPEILTGMADVNHWTAWQIDNATFRHHLEPSIRLMADSLTEAFLYPALAKSGFGPEDLKRVRIWYDAGQITENPNRRQDALDALDRILIGPAAGREALGFNDGDAPTPEEALQLIAARSGMDTSAATAILAGFARQDGGEVPQLPAIPEQRQLPAGQNQDPAAEPDAGAPGGSGAPSSTPPGIAASAHIGTTGHYWTVLSDERGDECKCGVDLVGGECSTTERTHNRLMAIKLRGGDALVVRTDGGPVNPWTVISATRPGACVCGARLGERGCGMREDAHYGLMDLATVNHRPDGSPLVASTAPTYRSLFEDCRALAEIDVAVRDLVIADADAAARAALQKAGSRLRAKTTKDMELHGQMRPFHVETWAARIGQEQCLKLGADARFLLAGAWESVSRKFADRINAGILKVIARVLRALGLKAGTVEGAATAARMRADMEARIDPAWARLQDGLDAHLEKVMFAVDEDEPGEAPELNIPPGLVRDALAFVGGMPETSAGMHGGRSVTGEPVVGLGTGTTVVGELTSAGAVHLGFEWRYGYMPRSTFEPHLELDGQRFQSWSDGVLSVDERAEWLRVSHYHPGDHKGCLCSYFTVYALPEGGQPDSIVAQRLAQPPTSAMADLIRLADMDDQAGRNNTTAQQQRDQYLAVRGLQRDFLDGGA